MVHHRSITKVAFLSASLIDRMHKIESSHMESEGAIRIIGGATVQYEIKQQRCHKLCTIPRKTEVVRGGKRGGPR